MWQRFASLIILAVGILAGVVCYKVPLTEGLDISGGIHMVIEAEDTDKVKVTDQVMSAAMAVVRNRVDALGVAEPLIQRKGNRQLIVDLAGIKDPQDAVKMLGETAHLDFRRLKDRKAFFPPRDAGLEAWEKTGIGGEMLKDARVENNGGRWVVAFEFNSEGAKAFGDLTTELAPKSGDPSGKPLGIFLDDKLVSAPVVNGPITGGSGIIEGNFDVKSAKDLVIKLKAGQLPVPLKMVENRTVGPSLGQEAVKRSLEAGLVGMALVLIFMIAYYRLPGFLANLALIIYTLVSLAIFKLIPVTMSIPGIAGFVLSIGMAVDANILIFERTKEELALGKSLYNAIDAGFKRAFSSIFDSNVTTIISCSVLFYFGTGMVRGFALTLAIGTLVSMFSAITVTRTLLRMIIGFRTFKNPALYGMRVPTIS
jgi:preprotein translocase subunit SecD